MNILLKEKEIIVPNRNNEKEMAAIKTLQLITEPSSTNLNQSALINCCLCPWLDIIQPLNALIFKKRIRHEEWCKSTLPTRKNTVIDRLYKPFKVINESLHKATYNQLNQTVMRSEKCTPKASDVPLFINSIRCAISPHNNIKQRTTNYFKLHKRSSVQHSTPKVKDSRNYIISTAKQYALKHLNKQKIQAVDNFGATQFHNFYVSPSVDKERAYTPFRNYKTQKVYNIHSMIPNLNVTVKNKSKTRHSTSIQM